VTSKCSAISFTERGSSRIRRRIARRRGSASAWKVPINDYPTTESFAEALRGFGSLVTHVDLLSALAGDGEAMLSTTCRFKASAGCGSPSTSGSRAAARGSAPDPRHGRPANLNEA
jgi:hypothetical protein